MTQQTEWYPISLDVNENQKIMNRLVARQLIRVNGDQAHLVALEQMLKEDNFGQQRDWRQVLDIIDEINKGESKC